MKRCGQAYGSSGENIGSEFKVEGRNHALQTVMGLIIDDGVSSRGHRKNIFSKDFKYVGISSRVQQDKIITVIDFHSENLPTKNGSSNNSNAGSNLQYEGKGYVDHYSVKTSKIKEVLEAVLEAADSEVTSSNSVLSSATREASRTKMMDGVRMTDGAKMTDGLADRSQRRPKEQAKEECYRSPQAPRHRPKTESRRPLKSPRSNTRTELRRSKPRRP